MSCRKLLVVEIEELGEGEDEAKVFEQMLHKLNHNFFRKGVVFRGLSKLEGIQALASAKGGFTGDD